MTDHALVADVARFPRPACSCGWTARLPRLSPWAAAKAHAVHVLAAAGGRLEALYLPAPERYAVRWEVRADEASWRVAEIHFPDATSTRLVADLLDNLPSAVRNVTVHDLGASDAA